MCQRVFVLHSLYINKEPNLYIFMEEKLFLQVQHFLEHWELKFNNIISLCTYGNVRLE